MGATRYWSVEECCWVECPVAELPEQREAPAAEAAEALEAPVAP